MERTLLFSLLTIISLSASSQNIFKNFNRSVYHLTAETQKRMCVEDYIALKFLKNDTLVFEEGNGLTMEHKEEILFEMKFSKKEIAFFVEHYLWADNFNSFNRDSDGKSYLCTSNDIEKTFVLTTKSNPNFTRIFKILSLNPFTLVVLE